MIEQVKIEADDVVLSKQQTLIALAGAAKSLRIPPTTIKAARAGQRLSQFKGRGMEFDEARPYQPGDDIRTIDWKVTARTQKTHTKVFRQERERPVHVWVDNRNSMQFGTKSCFKSVIAAQIASLLAWNAIAQSDRVGGMVFSEHQHQEFRPKMGRSSVLQLIHLLSEAPKKGIIDNSFEALMSMDGRYSTKRQDVDVLMSMDGRYSTKRQDAGVLNHAFYRLRQTAKPGSLVYLISDFNGFNEPQQAQLAQLSKHNDVALIHIYDSIEQALPPSGTYHLQSLAKRLRIQTKSDKVRAQYADAFEQKQTDLEQFCQQHRLRFLSIATHEKPIELMRSWLNH